MSELLTAAEVAKRLKVPASWVYAETRAGRLPHVRLGPRYRRYRWEAIEQWVAELERGPGKYRSVHPSGAGTWVSVPAGMLRRFRNTGDGALRVLSIHAANARFVHRLPVNS